MRFMTRVQDEPTLAVHGQRAVDLIVGMAKPSPVAQVHVNRALQGRSEGAGGVERPAVGIVANMRGEAVCVGWAHARAAQVITRSAPYVTSVAGDHRAVVSPVPRRWNARWLAAVAGETPRVGPVHASRDGRHWSSRPRAEGVAPAARGQQVPANDE